MDLIPIFLEYACWDHHVHGKSDHRMYDRAAQRHLQQHPEIARDSLYTAIVCGLVDEVERILTANPKLVNEPGGSRGWPPLLYLCYTRFTHQATIDNAVAIGRMLLERGADPNSYYMAYDSRYTALVGVAGEGEQDSPRQPRGTELFKLLLEYGAEPFDIQVLYNTHFSGDVLWWLDLIYAHTINSDRSNVWEDPNWMMLDMGGYGSGAQFLLRLAVKKNNLELAEWCLSRGARPLPQPPPFKPEHANAKTTDMNALRVEALRQGFNEMADLLVRYGASPREPVFEGEEAFAAACFRRDEIQVAQYVAQHPEYLKSPTVIFTAAQRDRDDVVALLLDLGVPIEIEERGKKRLLHEAAINNSIRVARLLIEKGAEVDPLDGVWHSPPIGWAVHADHRQMIDFLAQFSRNIWRLAFMGYVDRLREVLETQPELAQSVSDENITPLWWLPDDEKKAVEIVKLLLSHGADPAAKSIRGTTAADWATKRGMTEVVKLLEPSEGLGASY